MSQTDIRTEPVPREGAWRLWSVVAVVAALAVGGLLGLVIIPVVQGGAAGIDPYTAICRAFGVLPGSPARPIPTSEAQPQPVTRVSWGADTMRALYGADRKHGEQLAQERCVACHAVDGSSPDPTIPRNNGQSATAIYKQLHDYQSGARQNEIMSAQVEGLSEKDIADLAAFYSRLVRGDLDPQHPPFVGAEIENLVARGDSTRELPPCAACHGRHAGGPIETPTLTAQYPEYLEAQLKAYASGARHNDIYHRMRSVASRLTAREIHLLALYYSGSH